MSKFRKKTVFKLEEMEYCYLDKFYLSCLSGIRISGLTTGITFIVFQIVRPEGIDLLLCAYHNPKM